MYDTKKKIYAVLVADAVLMNLLASNKPFQNPQGVSTKANSVIPFDRGSASLNTPFITIQEGPETPIGEVALTEGNFYIRIYNSKDKSFEDIRIIAQRIDFLLRDAKLDLAEGVNVVIKYDGSLAEAVDEAYQLNFREIRYRALNL